MGTGDLYIIATPIGNLGDITYRAVKILSEVDVVFCEDTRQTRKLLNHYGISVQTQSLHAHSSDRRIEQAVELLMEGKQIAYVTDSGTPGLSDPGAKLVSLARERGATVCPIPGPSALASLISVSGYQGRSVIFTGFLSRKPNKLRKELLRLKEFDGVIVIYESPYRIKKLISALSEIFPQNKVLIGREMTKFHEEFIFDSLENLIKNMEDIMEKGEFSVAVFNMARADTE